MDILTNAPPVGTPSQQSPSFVDSRRSMGSATTDKVQGNDGLQQGQKASLQEMEKATDQINKFVSPANTSIQFSIDKDTDIPIVKVVDQETKEVIRQIPGDEVLQIAKALDRLQGLLVKQQA